MPSTGAAKRAQEKNRRALKRRKVFEAYGDACTKCGEDARHLLTIEHIGGVLPHYRHKNGTRMTGEALYNLIIKENFPSFITVLCWNCNLGGQNLIRSSS